MLESLQPLIAEIQAAWAEEIEERVSAFDKGEMSSHSAEAEVAYYEAKDAGLGGRFLAAVEEATARALSYPNTGSRHQSARDGCS